MKQTDIERIIKQGSIRQKIKLFFTDVAHFNTAGQYTAEVTEEGELEVKDTILTPRERNLIYSSVKEPKDIKYYSELRLNNKAFILFMPRLQARVNRLMYLKALLRGYTNIANINTIYEGAINDMLDKVADSKQRELLLGTLIDSLDTYKAERYQEKGFKPFIVIPNSNKKEVEDVVKAINKTALDVKEFTETLKEFLKDALPLQPYKEFLKTEEDKAKAELWDCIKHIKGYSSAVSEGHIPGAVEKFTKEYKDKYQSEPSVMDVILGVDIPQELKIKGWDEIEVEVLDEDLQNIKNSGL
jgi:hypothetical protein